MIIGPKQTILSAGASIASGASPKAIAATDVLAGAGSLIKNTLGAHAIFLKVWTDGTLLGTVTIPVTQYPSFSDTPVGTSALCPSFTSGCLSVGALSAAVLASAIPSSTQAASHTLIFGQNSGMIVGCPCPSIYLAVTIGTANVVGLNIEARVVYPGFNTQGVGVGFDMSPNLGASVAWQPVADKLHGPWMATALNTALSSAKLKLWISGTADPDIQYMSGVDGVEASTTGYTSGFAGTAITLSGLSVTYDGTNNRVVLSGTLGTFSAIGVPTGYSVTLARIYIPGTSYSDSKVVATFDCVQSLNGGNFTITANAVGLGTIAV